MKKRILFMIGFLVALPLAMSLCACSGETDNNPDNSDVPNFPGMSIITAYNQASDLGYTGSLEDFIALISGKDGVDGKDGKDGVNGVDGTNGKDGKDGVNGSNGKDGRGIYSVSVTAGGDLIVTFTDGNHMNAGSVIVKCVHSYTPWQNGEAATCTSIGYDTRVCNKCGDVDYRFTEQLGHNYGNAVTIINSTCSEVGLKVLKCSRCGDTQSQPIELSGHDYSGSNNTCIYCGKSVDEIYLEDNFRFNLIDDGTAYEVGGKNKYIEGINGELIIPAEYNGLPVTKIMVGGFAARENIAKVVIPESVTEINRLAFTRCKSLKTVVIPKSVTDIQQLAFFMTDIDNVQIDSENPVYFGNGSFIAETATKTLIYGNSTVNIPDGGSVENIGSHAFSYLEDIGDIVIPEGVKTIEYSAFRNCYGVTSLTLPSTVTSIDSSAFYYCVIQSITVAPQNTVYKSIGNCLIEIESKTLIKGCNSSVIPDDGSVEIIGRMAFMDCKTITEISIPEGVVSIQSQAFYNTNANSISLPDTLQFIGDDAFLITPYYSDKNNWDNGALYIGKYLIKANSSLSSEYTVRDGTLAIACKAFQYNKSIIKLVIPDSVKYIGNSAFDYCSNLTEIEMGDGVQIIGSFAFTGCQALESVAFTNPESWARYTEGTDSEQISKEDMSNPEKAAELLRKTSVKVGNVSYGYVWSKSDEFLQSYMSHFIVG